MHQIDWNKLRLFHVVAEAGSFTEAARRLHVSQPALSRQINSLENMIGSALFSRHARGLTLTNEGLVLRKAVDKMVEQADLAQSSIINSRDKLTGAIRLTTTIAFGSSWLTENLREFFDLYPQIQVELVLSDEDVNLSKRKADAAIRFHLPQQKDLILRRLGQVRYSFYASWQYIQKYGKPNDLEDLRHHRLILSTKHLPDVVLQADWFGELSSMEPNVVLQGNTMLGICSAIETGVGIGLLPHYMVCKKESSNLISVLPNLETPPQDFYFVTSQESRDTARIAVLRDYLVTKIQSFAF